MILVSYTLSAIVIMRSRKTPTKQFLAPHSSELLLAALRNDNQHDQLNMPAIDGCSFLWRGG
jgi:hypothetical protein